MPDDEAARERKLVTFRLRETEYGVEITSVQEILPMQEITPLPEAPDFLEGIINLRGHAIPVVDLARKLGGAAARGGGAARGGEGISPRDETAKRIVVVNAEGRYLGVIVDSVSRILRIPAGQIEPPPDVASGGGRAYLTGVGKIEGRLLLLLDLAKVLSSRELRGVSTAPAP